MARVKDETLVSYVRGLNLDRDIVLGFEEPAGEIVAIAHAARYEVPQSNRTEERAEISFSVTPAYRGHGLAKGLMHAITEASIAVGIERLFAQCVASNRPMRSVFARTGWVMDVEDGEVLAILPLCPSRKDNNNLSVASSIP
jgi:GNAT superfamily N-acetyltransferase